MAKITVGCMLPNGIVLTHPTSGARVELAGLHSARKIYAGAKHASTEVEQDVWDGIKAAYKDSPLFKSESPSIFDARNETDAKAKAKELSEEKTGLEPLAQDAGGVKKEDGK